MDLIDSESRTHSLPFPRTTSLPGRRPSQGEAPAPGLRVYEGAVASRRPPARQTGNRTGFWHLESDDVLSRSGDHLDDHLRWLLDQLEPRAHQPKAVVAEQELEAEFWCVVWMESPNCDFAVAPRSNCSFRSAASGSGSRWIAPPWATVGKSRCLSCSDRRDRIGARRRPRSAADRRDSARLAHHQREAPGLDSK
jgi:hypothetical protein